VPKVNSVMEKGFLTVSGGEGGGITRNAARREKRTYRKGTRAAKAEQEEGWGQTKSTMSVSTS